MNNYFDNNLIDAGQDDGDNADPLIAKMRMKKHASITGLGDISKNLNNIKYPGTGLKSEIVELEENMHFMLSEGKYGYKYVEATLMSLGYSVKNIRHVFARLTGITPENWMNSDKVIHVPGNLPGFNCGWGEAKGSQYDYYFIMPYNVGFSIFGQKGDTQRDEVDCFTCKEQATEVLEKLVKQVHSWDRPLTEENLNKYRPVAAPIGTKVKEEPIEIGHSISASEDFVALDDYIYNNMDRMDAGTIERIVVSAAKQKKITAAEAKTLREAYLSIQADEDEENSEIADDGSKDAKKEVENIVEEKEEELLNKPFEDEINEDTPSQYFENNVEELKHDSVPAEIIDKVFEYIKYKNENLQNFELVVDGFKYTSVQTVEEVKKSIPVDEDTKEAFFDANALITLLLTVLNKSEPEGDNEKKAILIFSVVGGNIITADYVKTENNKMAALTEEGLSKMFFKI